MKTHQISDILAWITFDDGLSLELKVEGHLDCFHGLTTHWFEMHGDRVLLSRLNRDKFIHIGEEIRRCQDVKKVTWEVTETREVPER